MKSLVTGGGGFLGQYIVEKLVKRGDEVRVLGRRPYPQLDKMGVQTIQGDVRDEAVVASASKGMDSVFHVASKTGVWGKRKDFVGANVTGTENVINACKKNGVSRLIYTSSPSVVYGGEEDLENIDESVPYPERYNCIYAETKAMAEKKVLEANGVDGLLTVSIRPHLIWGPRDTNLIPRLVDRAKSGRLVQVGDGKNIVDTVYVDNAADAHLLAADRLKPGSKVCGSAYFITQGEPVRLWDWINLLLEGLGLPKVSRCVSYKTAYRVGVLFEGAYTLLGISSEPVMTRFIASQLAKSHFYNIDKAAAELDYNPQVTFEEGMKRLLLDYKDSLL